MTGVARITIRQMRGGTAEVDVIDSGVPGLVVHAAHGAGGWTLTHVPTGRLAGWWPKGSPDQVIDCALALGRCGDWDSIDAPATADAAATIMSHGGFISWRGSGKTGVYYSRDGDGVLVENHFTGTPS